MKKEKCTQCKKKVDTLTIFSKGECLKCHEKNFKFKKSNNIIKDFKNILNI